MPLDPKNPQLHAQIVSVAGDAIGRRLKSSCHRSCNPGDSRCVTG